MFVFDQGRKILCFSCWKEKRWLGKKTHTLPTGFKWSAPKGENSIIAMYVKSWLLYCRKLLRFPECILPIYYS